MKNRKIATFTYEGLGIPIRLINVPMKKVFGEWVIDIDLTKLQLTVLRALLHKPVSLSGKELRFIRKFLNLSTTEFGEIFGVSHVAVVKWESEKSHAQLSTDVCIRLHVLSYLQTKDKEFRRVYNKINTQKLSKHKGEKTPILSVDVDKDFRIAI